MHTFLARHTSPTLLVAAALTLLTAACGGSSASSGSPAANGSVSTRASSAAASPSSAPSAVTKLTVSINNNIPSSWPQYVASSGGIFAANGLSVDLQVINGGPAQLAGLISSQFQIIQQGGIEAANAAANGSELSMVATIVPVGTWVFMVPPSVHSAADLKGQKVGIPALGGGGESAARFGLPKIGIDPDKDVTLVAAGSVPNLRAALISGAVVGATVQPLDMVPLEQQGFHALFDLAALKIASPDTGIVVSRSYAASQRPVLQKYVDSLVQSVARMKQDRALAVNVLKTQLKSDDDQLVNRLYDFYMQQVFPPLPYPRVEQFTEVLPQLVKANPAVANLDLNSLVDPSFVQSAADRGLGR